jgi:MFS family permease
VQAGFILGTLVFALLAVADRHSARRVFFICALASAGCTLAAAASASSFSALWGWRAATGFCLAGIYPVGMKIASQWFPQGLGAALGLLVGALVIGTASPHALRALGAQWPWTWVFGGVAAASVAGGLLVLLAIPEPAARPAGRGAGVHLRDLASLWTDRRVRASVFGYFGHMWELYSMMVLVPLILATRLQGAALSWGAFAVIGAGAMGCAGGGALVRRWGSARVAGVQLGLSGLCGLLAPWLLTRRRHAVLRLAAALGRDRGRRLAAVFGTDRRQRPAPVRRQRADADQLPGLCDLDRQHPAVQFLGAGGHAEHGAALAGDRPGAGPADAGALVAAGLSRAGDSGARTQRPSRLPVKARARAGGCAAASSAANTPPCHR